MKPPNRRSFELSAKQRSALEILLRKEGVGSSSVQRIARGNDDGPAPPSFAQERIWFLHQLLPQSAVYNIPAAVRLSGRLDVARLERCLNEIVRRHEVLRTTFAVGPIGPLQVVKSTLAIAVAAIDVAGETRKVREAEALRLANVEAQRPFDTATGPLLRVTLYGLGDDEHLLLLVAHHTVCEVWSIAILFRELQALYDAFGRGEPPSLPALPIQYKDFAAWQRQWLQGTVLDADRAYWREQLRGNLPVLELPADRPRPPIQTFRGAWMGMPLSRSVAAAVRALSRSEGVTIFVTLLSAFAVLLQRTTGHEEMLIGSPVAGRNRPEMEGLIGLFINTLVLRVDLSGDPTFRQLVRRVRDVVLGAFSHQDIPVERVMEEQKLARDLSHTALFQVMFALQNTPAPELRLAGLRPGRVLRPEHVHNGTTKVDLTLFVEDSGEELVAGLEYSTDLFDPPTMRRFLEHFDVLARGACAAPDLRISRLPVMSPDEHHRMIVDWNDTVTAFPSGGLADDGLVPDLVAAQAARRPDAVAVVDSEATLSYGDLDRRANQLARVLLRHGVGPDVPVAILLERSTAAVLASLAVLKAGGAYLPLDPVYPVERLRMMLADSRARVLLTQRSLSLGLATPGIVELPIEDAWRDVVREPDGPVPQTATLESLAYVIYTSGSTGVPKGVAVEHRALGNLVRWHHSAFQVGDRDRATQLAGLSFDASVWELWPYLTAGASIHMPDDETRSLPSRLRDWLVERRISITFLPTPLAESVLPLPWPRECSLRFLLTGGDKLHRSPPAELPFELVNNYGPTESAVVATSGIVAAGGGAQPPPIGRPIANVRAYVLDRHLQPVPIGIPGDLYLGGQSLARGYLYRPELTAERFIPDPFSAEPGARLYKTGDQARYLPDANIEFLGRNDFQVKIRGFRIELGEIEAVLGRHPAVREAVVIAREDVPGDKRLVAHLVLHQGKPPETDELRRFLCETLPAYMVPSAFVFEDALPLTPNGKTDRMALCARKDVRPSLGANFVIPRAGMEQTIAAVWQEVLQIDKVGIHDNFFDLGGHSLLLARVHTKLQGVFDQNPSMIDLFRYPTISSLARYFGQAPAGVSSQAEGRDRARTRLERMHRRRGLRETESKVAKAETGQE